jgi:hypothetical protein
MKSSLCKGILILAAAIAASALGSMVPAAADDFGRCSNVALKGDYATRLEGKLLGMVTAAGPQIFPDPVLVDGVALKHFDGKGGFTEVVYALNNGVQGPGPKDPKTGFRTQIAGEYTVYPDCTGEYVDNLGPVHIETKFVLADQGRRFFGIVSRQHVATGVAIGGIACDIPTGCELLPQIHADNAKLR